MNDKLLGMYLAHAMGDALGFPHEFSRLPFTGRLEHTPSIKSKWQGVRYGVIGQTTDDTAMTLAAIYGQQSDDLISNYLDFANSTSLLGKNTRALFKGITTVEGFNSRYQKRFATSEEKSSAQSNGSLMRAAAFVFAEPSVLRYDTSLTNPNDLNLQCGMSYCCLLRELIQGTAPETAVNNALQLVSPELRNFAGVPDFPDLSGKDKGWIGYAWKMAMSSAFVEDYNGWMNWLIGGHAGCDADTLGAISGAVIGAKYGLTKLRSDPLWEYNLQVLLKADYSRGEFRSSGKYHPANYLNLFPVN